MSNHTLTSERVRRRTSRRRVRLSEHWTSIVPAVGVHAGAAESGTAELSRGSAPRANRAEREPHRGRAPVGGPRALLIAIPPKCAVSKVIGFIEAKNAIHPARVYGEREPNFVGQHFWARGCFVPTVGRGRGPATNGVLWRRDERCPLVTWRQGSQRAIQALTLTTSKASNLTRGEDPVGSQAREVELERSRA